MVFFNVILSSHTGMKCEARVEFFKSNHSMARVADLDA